MTAVDLRARIDREIAAIDEEVSGIVDAVLHNAEFQALEAAWRGVAYVVERVDAAENVEVVLWSYSHEEMVEDFDAEPDVTRTRFYRHVYTAEYGTHGGRPYGLLLANWDASPTRVEVELLGRLASVAAMAHAPFLLAASPELLRLRDFAEIQAMTHPEGAFDGPGAEHWANLRKSEDARYLGVLLPRVLLRLPYNQTGAAATSFVYDEETLVRAQLLWGSPIFAFAVRAADSFARYGFFGAIVGHEEDTPPLFDCHPALGREHLKAPVEVLLSRRLEQSLSELGFIPLGFDPVRGTLRFTGACSVQRPKTFGATDGGAAATASYLLGTRLPDMLLASRVAHCLKVMERERIGAHRETVEIEHELQAWISRYANDSTTASAATRLKYPFRAAGVTLVETQDSSGPRLHLRLQPHAPYMGQRPTLAVDERHGRAAP